MQLILNVMSYKGLPAPGLLPVTFDQDGGSIGRKAGNTLLLNDNEHIVSGRHAEIFFQNGGFFIRDVSTNGTLLVNSGTELKNAVAPLTGNELLRIGEYEIRVELLDDQPQAHFATGPAPTLDDPFAAFGFVNPSEPVASQIPPSPPQNTATPAFADVQPLFAGLDSFAIEELPTPAQPAFKELPPNSPFQDSFVAPEVGIAAPEPDIAQFLKGLDALDGLGQSSPPTAADVDPITLAAEQAPALDFSPTLSEASASAGLDADPFNLSSLAAITPAFGETSSEAPPVMAPVQSTVAAPVTSPPAASIVPTASVTPAAPLAAPADAELLQRFLAGAGITDSTLIDPQCGPEAMQAIGGLFRSLLEGLMAVLRARAEMKSEFRVAMTTLRSLDNNPLKFNPDVESVVKLLLAPKSAAFIAPEVAVAEAFRDIQSHQLAMTAGIQASLAEVLARFEPQAIEKRLGEGFMLQRKASCWEQYCQQYPYLKAMALDDFFGEAFAEAYEKQMAMLSRAGTRHD